MPRSQTPDTKSASVRLDKWLWAARFFKTRSLALDAVNAGHVRKGTDRVKPAHNLQVGELLQIQKEHSIWQIEVKALSEQRGNATAANLLYQETEASQKSRLEAQALRQAASAHFEAPVGRPSKRDRRLIDDFQRHS
jgi:ribosome-associated heat shock protein Hsp15